MADIIIIGHGGYSRGVKENLEMVSGIPKNMYFLDFEMKEDRSNFENKISKLLNELGETDILFCCDLAGATPYQIAAMYAANNKEKYTVIAGINSMAYMELALSSNGNAEDLGMQAVNTTKESVIILNTDSL